MPIISVFYGIIIRMNIADHNPPHFHAEYQGQQAAFDIRTGSVLAGELPPNATRIVTAWAKQHRGDLLRNWGNAKAGTALFRIPGADQ